METLWLTCYCHADCQPLKNIMRLPEKEAFALAKQLAQAHPGTTAFYRFADFENYYPRRMKTDRLLLEKFCSLGGQPREKHPLSFVLGTSDYLYEWFDRGTILRLPLEAVLPERVSFTLGDSMSVLSRQGDVTLLTLPMLLSAMESHPRGPSGYLAQMQKEYHYIEVQVWDDVVLPQEEP